MKKEDLRAALHQVQPDEALIQRTLIMAHEQKEPKSRRRPSYTYGRGGNGAFP